MLKAPGDVVEATVFQQPGAGLMVGKLDVRIPTLAVHIFYPGEVADAGIRSGLSSTADGFDPGSVLLKKWTDIDSLQHGFVDD